MSGEIDWAADGARERLLSEVAGFLTTFGHVVKQAATEEASTDDQRAIATCIQMIGTLVRGQSALLEHRNYYATAALGRQVIETTHLLVYLDSHRDRASFWLTASDQEIKGANDFRPGSLRRATSASDYPYSTHCAAGGHPRRTGAFLLPGSPLRARGDQLQVPGLDSPVSLHDLITADALQHAHEATHASIVAADELDPRGLPLTEEQFVAMATQLTSRFGAWRASDPLAPLTGANAS